MNKNKFVWVGILLTALVVATSCEGAPASSNSTPTPTISTEEAEAIVSACQGKGEAVEVQLKDGSTLVICRPELLDPAELGLVVAAQAITLASPVPGDEVIVGLKSAETTVRVIVVGAFITAPYWVPLLEAVEPEIITVLFGKQVAPVEQAQETEMTIPREYCGESMEEYFKLLLFSEALTRFMTPQNIDTVTNNPIFQEADQASRRLDEIDQNWRERNCYFYEQEGSPFSDYKRIRNAHFPADGSLTRWILAQLNLGMSTQEALEIIRELVSSWW